MNFFKYQNFDKLSMYISFGKDKLEFTAFPLELYCVVWLARKFFAVSSEAVN
jgi:hypothetical protein